MKRVRLNYSLHSLLLFVLFGASCGAFYQNYPAWRAKTIEDIKSSAVSGDGTRIAIMKSDQKVYLFDSELNLVSTFEPREKRREIKFSSSGEFLFFDGGETSFQMTSDRPEAWNVKTNSSVQYPPGRIERDSPGSRWMVFTQYRGSSETGNPSVSAAHDELCILETATARMVCRLPGLRDGQILQFSRDDKECLIINNGDCQRWNLENGTFVVEPKYDSYWFTPDFKTEVQLKVDYENGRQDLQVFDVTSGKLRYKLNLTPGMQYSLLRSSRSDEFVLTHTNDKGLSYLARFSTFEPRQSDFEGIQAPINGSEYISPADSHFLLMHSDYSPHMDVWDRTSGAYCGKWPITYFFATGDKIHFLDEDGVYEFPDQVPHFTLPSLPSLQYVSIRFLGSEKAILAVKHPSFGIFPGPYTLTLFKKHRPDRWWGVVYMVEFWITVGLLILFIGNLVRTRKGYQGLKGQRVGEVGGEE